MGNEQSNLTILLALKDQVSPGLERARNQLSLRKEAAAALKGVQLPREELKKGISISGIADTDAGDAVSRPAIVTSGGRKRTTAFGGVAKDFVPGREDYGFPPGVPARLQSAVGFQPEESNEDASTAQELPLGLCGLRVLQTMASMLVSWKTGGLERAGGGDSVVLSKGIEHATGAQQEAGGAPKGRGIDPSFLDDKGEFAGEENLIKQLEELQNQPPDIIGQRLGTKEERAAPSTFIERNLAGHSSLLGRQQDSLGVLIRQQAALINGFSAKLTALRARQNWGPPTSLKTMGELETIETSAGVGRSTPGVIGFGKELETVGEKAGGLEGILGAIAGMSNLELTLSLVAAGAGWELVSMALKAQRKEEADQKRKDQQYLVANEAALKEVVPWVRPENYWRERAELFQTERNAALTKNPGRRAAYRERATVLRGSVEAEERGRAATDDTVRKEWKLFRGVGELEGNSLRSVLDFSLSPDQLKWRTSILAPLTGEKKLFNSPSEIIGLIKQLRKGQITDSEGQPYIGEAEGRVEGVIKKMVPEGYKDAPQTLEKDRQADADATRETIGNMGNLNEWFGTKRPGSLSQTNVALDEFAKKLSGLPPSTGGFAFGSGGATGNAPKLQGIIGPQRKTDLFGRPLFRFDNKAEGGRVLRGVSYVGGERGMELFTPGQDGWVTPNDKLHEPATRREGIVTRAVAMRGGDVHHNHNGDISVHVNVPPGRATEDPEALADYIEKALTNRIARYRERA
jgi:hypothetical protein